MKKYVVKFEQFKFTQRQAQLTANQLQKTKVTMKEVEGAKPDQRMFRSLGRLFLLCPKEQILKELGENEKTLSEESEKYKTMSQNFKDKQDHYTK